MLGRGPEVLATRERRHFFNKVSEDSLSAELVLQTRAPWTEVKLAQMTESCLAGVQRSFGPSDQESPKSYLRLGKQGLRPCNPMLRQCNGSCVPTISLMTFLRPLQSTLGQIS